WREANSHATMVIALCELVETGFEWMTPENVTRVHDQIVHGLRYLAILQDATTFRFDASDLMPGAVGAGTFWTEITEYVNEEDADLDRLLDNIDESWP
ncbi:MAG: hypothetical protein ACOCV0_03075, partial [Alkalispirochaeta sp.]